VEILVIVAQYPVLAIVLYRRLHRRRLIWAYQNFRYTTRRYTSRQEQLPLPVSELVPGNVVRQSTPTANTTTPRLNTNDTDTILVRASATLLTSPDTL